MLSIKEKSNISYIYKFYYKYIASPIQTMSFDKAKKLLVKVYMHFSQDSLYRNSIYLMLSTGSMSFFGFFFWIINARIYSTEEIGIATALISLVTLINNLSTLGLNTGIVRYLPKYSNKNAFINTTFAIVGITALIVTLFYLLFIQIFSPQLIFVRDNTLFAVFFILFTSISAINMVSDSVFIAYKSAKYVFIYNFFYSITRLILPIFLIGLGAAGIFLAHTLGVIICLILTILFLYRKFNYTAFLSINKKVISEIYKFSLGNYIASFIGGMPAYLFPLIVLDKLGAEASAFYYMDMMIVGFLYMIPISISQSQLAESSHSEKELKQHALKSIKINAIILIPAIVLVVCLGKYILLAFGKEYSSEGLNFLWLMSLSALTVPINYIFGVYLKILKKMTYVNIVNIVGAVSTLLISYLLIDLNLIGIGIAIILGQIFQILVYIIFVLRLKGKRSLV